MKRYSISLAALLFTFVAQADSTISPSNAYSWSANAGWANWRGDGINGAIIGEYVCSGYLYAANTGWINLGDGHPANGIKYQNNSSTDFGVNQDGLGNLRGYAYSANMGWITFENAGAPKVDLRTGRFSGQVYGANVGWMSLSNAVASLQTDRIAPGADIDGDGIADAYEILWTGGMTSMDSTSDLDADGFSDLQEYLADTNPLDPDDNLRITSFAFNPIGTNTVASWISHPTRFYHLQKRADFNALSSWLDSSLGLIVPDAGTNTTRAFIDFPAEQRFLRVEAVRPLSP